MNISKSLEWAQGNPGAMSFLVGVGNQEVLDKIEKCKSIRGSNLWVLFSDLCSKDMDKVYNLCKNCPDSVLEDACSRQDYSGRKLVESYF